MTIDDLATAATTTHGQTGLYAARDFVRPDEEEEYAETLIKLMDELTPGNTVEQTFATEIMGATWRLRRCRLVEEAFGLIEDLDFDPMIDERTEKQQKSVDRARAQSHLILRRSLDELRKLQKGLESPLRGESRTIQEQIAEQLPAPKAAPDSGIPSMDALMALAEHQLAQRYREQGINSFCNPAKPTPPAPETAPKTATSFCNPNGTLSARSNKISRNAPCPCKSGAKYKKCYGGPAAQAVNQAA
jgi:vacuolar-type H+-ATPase subunit H